MRYRKGMPNFKQDNDDEDVLKKIKRNFFIEWRIADKHKMDIFENIDYFLDSNQEGNPKIVTGNALRSALKRQLNDHLDLFLTLIQEFGVDNG
ncbi:MAG: hypothetical protein ACLR43_04250 [Faecalibacillus faecis]